MKKYIYIIIFIFTISCTANKGVYWCGDHPCINKDEKEAYFKKTMIVEVKNYNKGNTKKDSEIEKLLNQAKLNEKKRKLGEKELLKRAKIDEKELIKRKKLEEKKKKKEEKELIKQLKLEEKKIKKKRGKAEKLVKKDNVLKVVSYDENVKISSKKFEELVKKIIKRNSSRPYPEINDIPK